MSGGILRHSRESIHIDARAADAAYRDGGSWVGMATAAGVLVAFTLG
ncbi:hypothetical protein HQO42_18875 [Rhodococcus fascians]|nr:hypothetical protein [Rhodococcus fascians]MBY4238690.1 hypothetical protein [Rhodococcus fascians]MBY4254721.1 hypothetical protein [Rhodococcus fascians]MBY4270045.1 hypothetical protein [Rhodococcus fascians]